MLVQPLYSQKRGAFWINREGQKVPLEIYIGKRKPVQNLRDYIRWGYRFSERRKSQIRLTKSKPPRINPFEIESEISRLWPKKLDDFVPEIREQYILTLTSKKS